jgi:hypothetical protein
VIGLLINPDIVKREELFTILEDNNKFKEKTL